MQTPKLIDAKTMTDAELGEIYALSRQVISAAAPGDPPFTLAELVSFTRHSPEDVKSLEWVVDGGYASLHWREGNPEAFVGLAVAEPARRRGLGSHLLAFVAEQARGTGHKTLIGAFADAAGAGFAAHHGARLGNSDLVSTLHLPTELEPRPVPGYTLRSWVGPAPEELIESWARAMNAINDAPHTEEVSDWLITPEKVRDQEASVAARGRQARVTVALDADGEIVGSTELRLGPEPGTIARTDDSSVVAAHRRKGLARWLKTESLAALMAARPDVRIVRTSNDATNTGMLAVNHSVGFKTVATWTHATIDL